MQFKHNLKFNQTRLEQFNFLRIYLCCILLCVIVTAMLLFCSAFGDINKYISQYIKTLRMHALNTYIKLSE